jgi:hypothetical protein
MPASPPALPSGDFVRTVRRVFLLVPLAVVGLLLVWFVVFVLRSGAEVRRLEAAARARNEPLTLAEVAQTYAPVPDEENAAVPLLALWRSEDPEFWEAYLKFGTNSLPTPKGSERLRAFRDKSTAEIRRGEFSAAEVEQLTTEVADHAAHREAVREALARPQFRFPLQLAAGAGTLMPHLARMKEVALEFRAEGWLAVQLGDADRAIRALTDSASLAQLLQDEPILISQLVRISGCALALSQAEQLLSRLRLDEHHLGAVETAIRSLSQGDGFRDSMIHERACGIAMFENPKMLSAEVNREEDSPENQYGLSLALAAYGVTGLRQADKVVFLATFEHQLTNAPLNAPERLSAVEAAGSNVLQRIKAFPPKIISGILLPGLSRAAQKFCHLDAHRDAALTALAIERFRRAHDGALPETLQQLVPTWLPKIPTDIFDGQPLRYRRLDSGYVVYSVGPDRLDNGGKERPKKGNVKKFDLTFTVER